MAETAYRLSIAPALEPFRPEIEFACDFLDAAYALHRKPHDGRVLHYGPDAPAHAVAVPAALFPGGVRVDANGIHPVTETLAAAVRRQGGLRPPADGALVHDALSYDALGLIFLLLTRLEERDHPAR